jgi:predicted transporter
MRALVLTTGVLALLAGLWFLLSAVVTPYLYKTTDLSAIQATQIYSMGTYNAVLAIACFALAGLCLASSRRAYGA